MPSRRPTPAMVMAIIALVAGLAGTANAAKSLITGKQIKDRSISLSDLSPAARKSLAGKLGPVGPAGAPGLTGAAGTPGATGPSDAFTASTANVEVPDAESPSGDPTSDILSVNVPAGSYVIHAHSFMENVDVAAQIDCRLEAGVAVDAGRQDLPAPSTEDNQQMTNLLAATVTGPTTIHWKCTDHGDTFDLHMTSARIVAIKVGTLTGS